MLRRGSRALFAARNRRLLLQSSRAVAQGATNPNIVGANKGAAQKTDAAGQSALEFGKNENESSMFAQAASAWGTMRKIGSANPVEASIERYEERYQTEGTGAEQKKEVAASGPSLWERAKEAVQAVKESITPNALSSDASLSKTTEQISLDQQQVNAQTLEQQKAAAEQLRKTRPGFADDATGHRPWNWDLAQDSLRNSTDGMGIIEPVGPSAAEYEANHREWSNTQVNDNLKAQKEEFKSAKQDLKENWQEAKQEVKGNWQAAKQDAKENWQETKQAAQQTFRDAKNTFDEKFGETKEAISATTASATQDLKDKKEEIQLSWMDTKEVAKDGFREAGEQLKKGFTDIKEGVKNIGQAARESSDNVKNLSDMAKPGRVEESYEELYNQPPGQGYRAAAERLTQTELKDAESTTRQEVQKGASAENPGEKNSQVPKKKPTRYGDWEYGSRASDF